MLLRWETEALLATLPAHAKITDWKEALDLSLEGHGNKNWVSLANDVYDGALGFGLNAPEFTSEQLDMMVQLNKEMNEG